MPGVSRKTIWASCDVKTPWIEVRVVCGLSATMAILVPIMAFNKVDLPELGRPRIETNPDRKEVGSAIRHSLGFTNSHLCDTQLIAGQNFDPNAVPLHYF